MQVLKRTAAALRVDNSLPLLLFCSLFFHGLIYRGRLYARLVQEEDLSGAGFISLFSYLHNELLFAALVAGLAALIHLCLPESFLQALRRRLPAARVIGLVLVNLFLALVAALYTVHYGLTFSIRAGLTWDMLVETFAANAALSMTGEMSLADYFFILLLFGIFWAFYFSSRIFIIVRNHAALAFSVLILMLSLTGWGARAELHAGEVRKNPVLYTLADIVYSMTAKKVNSAAQRTSENQLNSVSFVHEDFTRGEPSREKFVRRGSRKKWNLLFVILESTGGDYVFDTSRGNEMPMPFLRKTAEQSLHMTNHFSTANTTPRGSFSVFSGLYPAPRLKMFVTGRDVHIPALPSYLPAKYSKFLLYNGDLDWFFPRGFFQNNKLTMMGHPQVPGPRRKPSPKNGRNEGRMVDYFLQRLDRLPEPFFAVYHSYLAHWPYIDYGPRYDVFSKKKKKGVHRWVIRYYNNLRMMDGLLRRVFQSLRRSGRLDNTIIVITGDHGQAFGKHKGNWIHSRASFNENYRVPMVIYQPRLFKPRKIRMRTQHVDILPTLFEKMGVAYNPRLIQGENILKKTGFQRRFDFLYGNERTISSIDRKTDVKLQISLKNRSCWAWNLKRDPDQRKRLSCARFGEQKRILLGYLNYQNQILDRYNQSAKSQEAFFGQKHPPVKSSRVARH